MAITGQFGRVVTGSSSMASAIAGIAEEFAALRIDNIYNAFINGSEFEGGAMTAARAISMLSDMLSDLNPEGKMAGNIKDAIVMVRKSNRNMILNKIDAELELKGYAEGDYGNKVKVLQDMLLDPTLSPDDRTSLQADLSASVDKYIAVLKQQFGVGGSVMINGSSVNFAGFTNTEALNAEFDRLALAVPESAERITREKNLTAGLIAITKAQALWDSVTRTTDKTKLDGYNQNLEILRPALAELERLGLGQDPVAISIIGTIRDLEANAQTASDNISQTAANAKYAKDNSKVWDQLLAIDTALGSPQGTMKDALATDPNYALQLIDSLYLNNGGKEKITDVNGNKIDITRAGLYDLMRDAKNQARDLFNWSQGNKFVDPSVQVSIAATYEETRNLMKKLPLLKAEDKYDDAKETLEISLKEAGTDVNARQAAIRSYADALVKLSGTLNSNPRYQNALITEARFFRSGDRPADAPTFGELTYNVPGTKDSPLGYDSDYYLAQLIHPTAIGAAPQSVAEAIAAVNADKSAWNSGEGMYYEDPYGAGTIATVHPPANASDFANGAAIRISKLGSVVAGDTTIDIAKESLVRRYRLVNTTFVTSGGAEGQKLEDATLGWVAQFTAPDGTKQYIVTKKDGTTENILNFSDAQALIRSLGGLDGNATTIGKRTAFVLTADMVAKLNASLVGSKDFTYEDLYLGGSALNTALADAQYTYAEDMNLISIDSINAALKSKDIKVVNGKVFENSTGVYMDITSRFTVDMVKTIVTAADNLIPDFSVVPGTGDGAGTGVGTDGLPAEGVGLGLGGGAPGGNGPIGMGGVGRLPADAIAKFKAAQAAKEAADQRAEQAKIRAAIQAKAAAEAKARADAAAKARAAAAVTRGVDGGAIGSIGVVPSVSVVAPNTPVKAATPLLDTFMRNVPPGGPGSWGVGVTPVQTKPLTVVPRNIIGKGPVAL